jgi:hypothetical protein
MRLHITNGDSAAGTLRQAVDGTVATWSDVLHEGPVPALPAHQLIDVRANYLASRGYVSLAQARADLRRQADMVRAVGEYSEVVLWFEHDLFDQLLLIQVLTQLASVEHGRASITLICIGEFAGIDPFVGLGQLSAEQMRSLEPTRTAVTPIQFAAAREAWAAFTAPAPGGLERLAFSGPDQLPFLGDALRRLLAEFPSVENGLGRVERLAIEGLAHGNTSGSTLFRTVSDRERHPFLGDTPFYAALRDLARAPQPLLAVEASEANTPLTLAGELRAVADTRFTLTAFGQRVLAGREDAVRVNGIERWIGGVHLEGHEAQWRWDSKRGALRQSS